MKLYVRHIKGKKVELAPTYPTREKMRQRIGPTFTLGASDYRYSASDVFAEPGPNLAAGWMILVFLFTLAATKSMPITLAATILSGVIAWLFHVYDTKCAIKFNQSI